MSDIDLTESVRRATDAALLLYAGAYVDGAPSFNAVDSAMSLTYGRWYQAAAEGAERRRCRQPCPVAQRNLEAMASAVASEANRIIVGLVCAYASALVHLAEARGVSLQAAAAEILPLPEGRP